jgi:hypothetical protein
MPFVLKNARATYERMVKKVFKHQFGRIIEAYMDDMVVKNITFKHLKDLKKFFFVLCKC